MGTETGMELRASLAAESVREDSEIAQKARIVAGWRGQPNWRAVLAELIILGLVDVPIDPGAAEERVYAEEPQFTMAGKTWIRCMGGHFCKHAPNTCTASLDYQMARDAQPETIYAKD